jgi:hypothetical protein
VLWSGELQGFILHEMVPSATRPIRPACATETRWEHHQQKGHLSCWQQVCKTRMGLTHPCGMWAVTEVPFRTRGRLSRLRKGGAAGPARFWPGGASPPGRGPRGGASQCFRGRLPPASPHLAKNGFEELRRGTRHQFVKESNTKSSALLFG